MKPSPRNFHELYAQKNDHTLWRVTDWRLLLESEVHVMDDWCTNTFGKRGHKWEREGQYVTWSTGGFSQIFCRYWFHSQEDVMAFEMAWR
jgi:glycyl-tRNA synthetase alpha subunit